MWKGTLINTVQCYLYATQEHALEITLFIIGKERRRNSRWCELLKKRGDQEEDDY